MKLAFLATALAAAVATVPATPAVSPAAIPEQVPEQVPEQAPQQAPAFATAPAPAAAPSTADSATQREIVRLARLSAEDAARQSREPTIRNAPGRESVESGSLHRCVDAAGGSIFTDRACVSLDAIDTPQLAAPTRAGARLIAVRSCARSREDLLDGVRSALEIHDVNRLADYYHWTGMDGAEGYRLMDRLDAFSKRPFVDARLVSSRAPPVVDAEVDSSGLLSRPSDPGIADLDPPRAPLTRAADLLRVDQMRSDRDAAAEVTWFRLRPNAGCWWMQY